MINNSTSTQVQDESPTGKKTTFSELSTEGFVLTIV